MDYWHLNCSSTGRAGSVVTYVCKVHSSSIWQLDTTT
jgi:hypothetical protein